MNTSTTTNNSNKDNITYGDNDVAIIGLGLRLPGHSCTPLQLWENLLGGFDGIVETTERWSDTFSAMGEISSKYAGLIDLDEWMSFDPLFFGINPTDGKQIDPQQKLLLKCTWEAFEDANIDPFKLRGTNTSVYIGASSLDYASINIDLYEQPMNIFNSNMSGVSNRISYCYDFRGTSLTIDTACSSSLNAVHLGYKSIVNGESDYSIVGGCNFMMSPHTSRSFESIQVTSKTGKSKTFDEDANGFVRAEGVVSIILKKMSKAIEDGDQIYTVIKGSSSNVDGNLNKGNFFAPSKVSQANNIKNAFECCKKDPKSTPIVYNDIDFFELHGTGTQIGDPIECEGVSSVFKSTRETPLLIGSIKANIGHLEPASGVASLAKVALMFKYRQFVKNINFEKPNPNIKFDEWKIKVCTENTPFPNDRKVSMAINSFGITGSNACLIMTEYIKPTTTTTTSVTPPTPTQQLNQKFLIPISANSKTSLESYKEKLINSNQEFSSTIDFKDFVKYQLNSKTQKLTSRSVIIASNWEEVNTSSIISTNSNRSGNIIKKEKNPQLVYVFSGQGSQWSKMATQLYSNEPIFKESIDKIDLLLSNHFGYSIFSKLNSISDDDTILINEPILAQPSIFMIQISLIELYKHWGIEASISIGHSLGEVSSAVCSGMIDLETACLIIYHRSRLQQQTIGSGRMLAIGLNEDQFNKEFGLSHPSIEIACFNSQSSIVLSGNESELTEINSILKGKEIFSTFLGTQSAFHSSKQEVLKDEILTGPLKDIIKSNKPIIPNFSTVTSNLFYNEQQQEEEVDGATTTTTTVTATNTLFDSNYIYENLRKPVLFEKSIKNIFDFIEKKDLGSSVIFLEISPSPVLINYIKEMIPQDSTYFYVEDQTVSVLSSLNKKSKDQVLEVQTSISQVYCKGYNVNFNCPTQIKPLESSGDKYKDLSSVLFRYSWDDTVYWREAPTISNYIKVGPSINQLGNRNDNQPYLSFISLIDVKEEPYEFFKGHNSRNRIIYPGCAYIDSLLKAFPDQDLTIQSLEFKSAILLLPSIKTHISTNIIPSGKNEYRVSFHHKDKQSNKWILSCNGRVSTTKLTIDKKKMDISKLREKCSYFTLEKKELYQAIKDKAQLTFEGKFASIDEAMYGEDCCLSKVPLSTLSSYDNQSFLNLCVIDSGFQPLAVLKENQQPMVFSSVENLQFFSENIPRSAAEREKHQFVYTFSQILAKKSGLVFVSIITMLQDGTVLFFSPNVVTAQLTAYRNNFLIESPNENLFRICYQSKDSPLPTTSTLINTFKDNDIIVSSSPTSSTSQIRKALVTCLYSIFKKTHPTLTESEIQIQSVDYLTETYCLIIDNDDDNDGIDDNSILVDGGVVLVDDMVMASETSKIVSNDNNGKRNLSKLIFQVLKNNLSLIDYSNLDTLSLLLSTKQLNIIETISKLIITPISITNQIDESDKVNKTLNIDNKIEIQQYQLISQTISNLIQPIVNEKVLFRILEINSNFGSLTELIFNKIIKLLNENENSYQIEIEFTFTLSSGSGIDEDSMNEISNLIKEKLLLINSGSMISIIFKPLNLNESFLDQSFKPTYYDIIVLTNLSNISNLNQTIENVESILYQNGHLIIIDTNYQSLYQDYENYEQWLVFDNFGGVTPSNQVIRNDWNKLLIQDIKNKPFVSDSLISTKSIEPNVIQVQKLKLMDTLSNETPQELAAPYDQFIIFGDKLNNVDEEEHQQTFLDVNKEGTDVYRLMEIEEFEQHVATIPPTDKSMIIFVTPMNDLGLENYKSVNLEYIKINQYLLKNKIGCPFILASRNALKEGGNPLAAALIGTFRYFSEFSDILNLYSFDFDDSVYTAPVSWANIAKNLINPSKHIQREYIFRNGNETYFERIGKIKRVKQTYPLNSYLDGKQDLLVARLNQNLEYKLEAKESKLTEFQVEVQVVATGINFKDNLIYRNLVSPFLINKDGDFSKPEFGFECSGIVSRIGSSVTKFKVGDPVLGYCWRASSSHAINFQDAFILKPDNLSFVEAASIPLIYCTSYYALFYSGNLNIQKGESVLIHQASGGIGLACLNILKASGFKSKLFVTVGSKEKEDFLREKYGDFITGIYSSRNTDFLIDIKRDLSESDSNQSVHSFIHNKGIDVIINTLSFEFLESSFLLLGQGGRIVDLSVNHLNTNDTTDFNKFKWFIGYSTVEIFHSGFEKSKHILGIVTEMIKNKQLALVPITEYPINKIKEAIEYLGERKHIGKIVVNHASGLKDGCLNLVQDTMKSLESELKNNYLVSTMNYKFMGNQLGKTILFTGQTGLSLAIIQTCLLTRYDDLEAIIVFSKSPIKYELQYLIGLIKSKSDSIKTKIYFKQVDCSNFQDMMNAINLLYSENPTLPSVETVFHNAFVPVAAEPHEIDMKHLDDAYDAKTMGAMNLYMCKFIYGWDLKNFVFQSSLASVAGSPRQGGYCGANLVVESLAKVLHSQGIRCTSINWGSIEDIGYVSRNEAVSKFVQAQGQVSIQSSVVLGSLDLLLQQDTLSPDTTIVASFDYKNLSRPSHLGPFNLSYKFDYFTNAIQFKNSSSDNELSIREEILGKFAEFLSVEDQSKINLDIKLIDYGADSMTIVELKNWLDKTYMPNILSIQQLQNVSINQLIQAVADAMNKANGVTKKSSSKSKTAVKKEIDWVKEIKLDSSIRPTNEMIKIFKDTNAMSNSGTVFLTGSTGFVGIYILYYLIKSKDCKVVYCLTRRKTNEEALTFLIEFLKVHQLYAQLTKEEIDKIKPILGDYALDSFGVSVETYKQLSERVDLIINSAASVNFQLDYQDSKVETLQGVNQCIKFACSSKLKKLVQISTLGIYSDDKRDDLDDYTLAQIDPKQSKNSIINGYLQGKIVSEYRIKEAANRQIPCCIIRLPFIGPNPTNGVGRDLDIFQTMLQACAAMTSYPEEESDVQFYACPVTWIAQNISFISMNSNCWSLRTDNPLSENLSCFNLFGESIYINMLVRELANQLKWKSAKPVQFIKRLRVFDHPACKKLSTLLKSQSIYRSVYIPGNYKLNPDLKQLLQSNNSYEGWRITQEMLIIHLSYVFKKKLN